MINSNSTESQTEATFVQSEVAPKVGEIFSPNYPEIVGDKLNSFHRVIENFLKIAAPDHLKASEFVELMASAMAAKQYADGGNCLHIPEGEL